MGSKDLTLYLCDAKEGECFLLISEPLDSPVNASGMMTGRLDASTAPSPRKFSLLPNSGPKSEQMLRSAGIRSRAQLERNGAVKAYVKVCALDNWALLNFLWALEAALSGRSWQDVAGNDRLWLLSAAEDRMPRKNETARSEGVRRVSRPVRRRASAR